MTYPDLSKPGEPTIRWLRQNELHDIFELRSDFKHVRYIQKPRTMRLTEKQVYDEEVY